MRPDLIKTGLNIAGPHVPAIGRRLVALIKRLRDRPDDSAPGTWEVRHAAYLRFQEAALAGTQHLQLLASLGTPPSVVGAVWTWPAVHRANRRVMDSFNEALAALYEVRLVGDQEVQHAAVAVADALVCLTGSFPARRGGGIPPDFEADVQEFNGRLVDYVDAARTDLQQKD